jgi:hypothetical protein
MIGLLEVAARASPKVSGVVLVSFPCCWVTVCKILQPMRSKGRCLKKSVKHRCVCPRKPGNGDKKVQASTLLTQPCFAFIGRNSLINLIHRRNVRKKLKISATLSLGLELSIQVYNSPIHLVTQSLFLFSLWIRKKKILKKKKDKWKSSTFKYSGDV